MLSSSLSAVLTALSRWTGHVVALFHKPSAAALKEAETRERLARYPGWTEEEIAAYENEHKPPRYPRSHHHPTSR